MTQRHTKAHRNQLIAPLRPNHRAILLLLLLLLLVLRTRLHYLPFLKRFPLVKPLLLGSILPMCLPRPS